jgi:hypothetical protein
VTTRVSPCALRELQPGTGRVQSVVIRRQETWLCLDYPNGRYFTVVVPGVPDDDLEGDVWRDGVRPLAVRMNNRRATFDCSVLATSGSGPRLVGISIAQALALCASGVHAVFCSE